MNHCWHHLPCGHVWKHKSDETSTTRHFKSKEPCRPCGGREISRDEECSIYYTMRKSLIDNFFQPSPLLKRLRERAERNIHGGTINLPISIRKKQ